MKQIVHTDQAPKAIGPYSQAIKAGPFVFTAGQVAIDPSTGSLIEGDVAAQTKQVLENLKAVVEAAGTSLANAVKITVYLTKTEHFAPMNETYAQYFTQKPPARTTVFINTLPLGALVEIDVIAQLQAD
ncbi:MAG: RidA family protein [candidate division WOR-3 bacterium]